MPYTTAHYIQGQRYQGKGDKQHALYNPAQGELIGHVEFADQATIDYALQSARDAYATWSTWSPLRRGRILFAFKALLEQHLDELAELVTQEHGKTLADARGSIMRGIEVVEQCCGIAAQLKGQFSANVSSDIDTYTMRQALGVCVGITPFNFPVMVPIWLAIPAIACGNSFILKPSEQTPSVTLRLAELLTAAGLPQGVFNVLQGDGEVVQALISSPVVQAVSAVASTPVAKAIYQRATEHGKRAHTFGGAKNHCVIMPDADPSEVGQALLGAAFGSAGQRCMAISVAVAVGDEIGDRIAAYLTEKIAQLKIGPGDQPNIDMGPLISQVQLERVKNYLELGVQAGATLCIDGRQYQQAEAPAGFFIGGSLFDHVTAQMPIYQDEIFGPVLCLMRVPNLASAIELINASPYGNGTAIFTNQGDAARHFANTVQVGMVGINIPIPVPVAYHSFGGWKNSSFGDTGLHGDQSIQFYTQLKSVTCRWPKHHQAQFVMPTHE